ncbi:SRPBCC family protein [Chloroflexota bacterium]
MKVQRSITIAAPPEKIWPFMVEPDKILKWCITLTKFEYTGEQRGGVGTSFYFEEKIPGQLITLHFKITEWEENKRLAFSMTSGNFIKKYQQRWTVETIPSGSKFTFMEDIEFPYGIIGKILGLFARFGSQVTVRKMLTKLKGLAEV